MGVQTESLIASNYHGMFIFQPVLDIGTLPSICINAGKATGFDAAPFFPDPDSGGMKMPVAVPGQLKTICWTINPILFAGVTR